MNHETEIINDYSSDTQATSKRGNATVKAVVISGVSALAIGGVVGALTLADVIKWHSKSEPSMKNKEDGEDVAPREEKVEVAEVDEVVAEGPIVEVSATDCYATIIGDVAVATKVNDDMSFADAFAAARTDVGTGGAFVWHGDVYSTYTVEEWNTLSVADRSLYTSNFSWHNPQNANSGDVAQTVTDIEIVDYVDYVDWLGVETIALGDNLYEGMHCIVNGEDCYLFDLDNDGIYDNMLADLNYDGVFSVEEVFDISYLGILKSEVETQLSEVVEVEPIVYDALDCVDVLPEDINPANDNPEIPDYNIDCSVDDTVAYDALTM